MTMPGAHAYTLYGWEVSYYTGKVRSYLQRKSVTPRPGRLNPSAPS